MALIEIFVPCYNYGRYLSDCIGSIASQSVQDWKVVIADDASPDGSVVEARRLAAADKRIEVIAHETNRGHIATFNEGIERASAEFFMALSADDMLAPGALARALSVMRRHPEVVLTYGPTIEFSDGQPLAALPDDTDGTWRVEPGRDLIERLCATAVDFIPAPSVIVRTSAQKKAGGYSATLTHAEDFEMWLRIALLGDVAVTPAVQSLYRFHGGNMSKSGSDPVLRDYQFRAAAFTSFFDGPGGTMPDAARLRRLAQRRLAERAFWTGVAQAVRGRRQTSLELMRLVRRLNPATLVVPPVHQIFRAERLRRALAPRP